MKNIFIKTDYIKLDQFLKFVGISDSGSEAKTFILNNDVYVNGELEKRRGRKIYDGYTVKVSENIFKIVRDK